MTGSNWPPMLHSSPLETKCRSVLVVPPSPPPPPPLHLWLQFIHQYYISTSTDSWVVHPRMCRLHTWQLHVYEYYSLTSAIQARASITPEVCKLYYSVIQARACITPEVCKLYYSVIQARASITPEVCKLYYSVIQARASITPDGDSVQILF